MIMKVNKTAVVSVTMLISVFLVSCAPGRVSEKKSERSENEVSICFMGDVMMTGYFAEYIERNGVDYSWTEVSHITRGADISVVNLETTVSERGESTKPPGYGFRSDPSTLQGLVNAGIDLVSLANNHVMDYGTEAFFDTVKYLNKNRIKSTGAGKNINKAESPVFIKKNGVKIAFLAYTSIIPDESWKASNKNPGVAYLDSESEERVLENISRAAKKSDVVIVMLHWGREYIQYPSKDQIGLARQMIDSGAHAVIGHHPHVLQGIEFYRDKPIIYSIGNFIFLKRNELSGKTGIFELTFDKNGFKRGRIHPVTINWCAARLHSPSSYTGREIIRMLAGLSRRKGTIVDRDGSIGPAEISKASE